MRKGKLKDTNPVGGSGPGVCSPRFAECLPSPCSCGSWHNDQESTSLPAPAASHGWVCREQQQLGDPRAMGAGSAITLQRNLHSSPIFGRNHANPRVFYSRQDRGCGFQLGLKVFRQPPVFQCVRCQGRWSGMEQLAVERQKTSSCIPVASMVLFWQRRWDGNSHGALGLMSKITHPRPGSGLWPC